MQPTVRLSSRHFQSQSTSNAAVYTHDTEWISNGHWCIQRTCVANQYLVTPDSFEDNFQRPSTSMEPVDRPCPDFWDFVAFDPVDHRFRVTRWAYVQDLGVRAKTVAGRSTDVKASGTIQLRLLLAECTDEIEGVCSGDERDGSEVTCWLTTPYFCFLDENYVDALGLETGDVLEARWANGLYVLRTADLTRCVGSWGKLAESDVADLGSVVEVETELHGVTHTTTDGSDGDSQLTSQVIRRPRYKVDTGELARLFEE